jgi:hypothetical protein
LGKARRSKGGSFETRRSPSMVEMMMMMMMDGKGKREDEGRRRGRDGIVKKVNAREKQEVDGPTALGV